MFALSLPRPRAARPAVRPHSVIRRVRQAQRRHEFVLHLQPQVELTSGRVVGAEALVRWRCPGHGLLPPSAFLGAVQRSRLARAFDSWVLRTAVAEAAALRAAGHPLRVAVNVGPASIQDGALVGEVAATLRAADLPAHLLELELTEQALEAEGRAAATMAALARLGVESALDDFGIGFSSLTRVAELPFCSLKVDRGLLRSDSGRRTATVFASAVSLAHDLNLSVVAEGVETAETWRRIARLGVDRAQGWLIAPALPRAELLTQLDCGGFAQPQVWAA